MAKVKDRGSALEVIKWAKGVITEQNVLAQPPAILAELDSLANWVSKAEVSGDVYQVCYQLHIYVQGGGDVATYDNMRDIVNRLQLSDTQIIELARTKLGEIVGFTTEHGMADVYVLRRPVS